MRLKTAFNERQKLLNQTSTYQKDQCQCQQFLYASCICAVSSVKYEHLLRHYGILSTLEQERS